MRQEQQVAISLNKSSSEQTSSTEQLQVVTKVDVLSAISELTKLVNASDDKHFLVSKYSASSYCWLMVYTLTLFFTVDEY